MNLQRYFLLANEYTHTHIHPCISVMTFIEASWITQPLTLTLMTPAQAKLEPPLTPTSQPSQPRNLKQPLNFNQTKCPYFACRMSLRYSVSSKYKNTRAHTHT